jgi:hypothetical protein
MRRLVVLITALALALPAFADDRRTNTMLKFADVMATQKRCPSLAPNGRLIVVVAALYHIDFAEGTPDYEVLMALTQSKLAAMAELSDDAICTAGRYLYGPNGVAVKGLMVEQ